MFPDVRIDAPNRVSDVIHITVILFFSDNLTLICRHHVNVKAELLCHVHWITAGGIRCILYAVFHSIPCPPTYP